MGYEYEKLIKESAMINPPRAMDELQEVYRKAKAFDEIMDEFGHYINTLPNWDTIDYKDSQTLLEILKENKEVK